MFSQSLGYLNVVENRRSTGIINVQMGVLSSLGMPDPSVIGLCSNVNETSLV